MAKKGKKDTKEKSKKKKSGKKRADKITQLILVGLIGRTDVKLTDIPDWLKEGAKELKKVDPKLKVKAVELGKILKPIYHRIVEEVFDGHYSRTKIKEE